MKKYIFLSLAFLGISNYVFRFRGTNREKLFYGDVVAAFSQLSGTPKKKVVVFTSRGGACSLAAAKSIKDHLNGTEFNIQIVNIFDDVLSSADTIRTLTLGYASGEDVYNYFLRNKYVRTANMLQRIGGFFVKLRGGTLRRLVSKYLDKTEPDLVISVVPLVNSAIYKAASRKDIPFLVVSLDMHSYFVNDLRAAGSNKFKYALMFDDESFVKRFEKKKRIDEEQFVVTGFPLRADFAYPKNVRKLKNEFGVSEDKPVIMIMMGGAGSTSSYEYLKTINEMNLPAHVILCLGRNEALMKKVKSLKLNSNITVTPMGYTQRISDLMAISDILITKTGPGSLNEAIQMELPVLLDAKDDKVLNWERSNLELVEKHGLGDIISSANQFKELFKTYLTDKQYYKQIKENMSSYKKQSFAENIKLVARQMTKTDSKEENEATDYSITSSMLGIH